MVAPVIVSLFVGVALALSNPALEQAEQLYYQTQYQQALRLLETSQEKTASVYALMGKCYYMLEEYKKATDSLEKAVAMDSRNSSYVNWLGKAFGRRAETSSFFTAPSYASKTRQYFEKALALAPGNLEAVDDLFEYYLEAPGFLGGGQDKAARLAEQIREEATAKYHSLMARLAEKRKQWQEAEKHWHEAAELAPSEVGRLIDLAKFLARRGRHAESERVFEQAEKIAPESQPLKFERAKVYIEAGRHQETARKLLREYLQSSSLTPDDPPRSEAQRLLDKIDRS